jgi:hypothetical protein
MHGPETKTEMEVILFCNKPSPYIPMHQIKWGISETILCLLLAPSVELCFLVFRIPDDGQSPKAQ